MLTLSQRTVGEESHPAQISLKLLPPGSERLLYRKLFYDAKDITNVRRVELEESLSSTEAAEQTKAAAQAGVCRSAGTITGKIASQGTGDRPYRKEGLSDRKDPL